MFSHNDMDTLVEANIKTKGQLQQEHTLYVT